MVCFSDDDIFRRRDNADGRDGDRCWRNAHAIINEPVFVFIVLDGTQRKAAVTIIIRTD